MEPRKITLPNSPDTFLLTQLRERLSEGKTVRMAFGGISMLPLIDGAGDIVTLRPLAKDEVCRVGEVYLFYFNGHHIVHRLMQVRGGEYVFRGDNCIRCEHVGREAVLARLERVEHPDGTTVSMDSEEWRSMSERVLRSHLRRVGWRRYFSPRRRKVYAAAYFVCLALLMWLPLGGVPLDNYVFGIRADHLVHASIYLLCPLMLYDFTHKRTGRMLLWAVAVGVLTESVQYLLPYRGFDINDMAANAIGCLLGWLALQPVLRRRKKNISPRR